MSSFASAKIKARQRVHGCAGVAVTHYDGADTRPNADDTLAGFTLTARWHNRNVVNEAAAQQGSVILENVDKLVFDTAQIEALGLTLSRGDVITFPEYGMYFELDQQEDSDGPVNIYWTVSRFIP